jgi:hypothetical protein
VCRVMLSVEETGRGVLAASSHPAAAQSVILTLSAPHTPEARIPQRDPGGDLAETEKPAAEAETGRTTVQG